MDAAPQPRLNHQSNIASTGPPPRERHRNRGDTLKRNLASGTANYRGMVTATAAINSKAIAHVASHCENDAATVAL